MEDGCLDIQVLPCIASIFVGPLDSILLPQLAVLVTQA